MRMSPTRLLAIGLTAATWGAAHASSTLARTVADRCAIPHGARKILNSRAGKAWVVRSGRRRGVHAVRFFACAAGHRPVSLARGDDGADTATTVPAVAIANGLVAYGRVRKSGLGSSDARLIVRDVNTGSPVFTRPAVRSSGGALEFFEAVGISQGGVGWIASTIDSNGTRTYQVWKDDSGAHQLDAGSDVDPASLVVGPRQVGWRRGGVARSASLCDGCAYTPKPAF